MPTPVLFTGDIHHGEFAQARQWLRTQTVLSEEADLERAVGRLQNVTPTVIVIAQSQPGLFHTDEIERLHRLAPLARLVVLLGSWCEGETRTGQPLPGVFRVYWHQWEHRAPVEFSRLLAPSPGAWSLPRTASAAEQTLTTALQAPELNLRAAIYAADHAAYSALATAVTSTGSQVQRITTADAVAGFDLLIFDAGDFRPQTQQKLKEYAARAQCCVAVLGFPRGHEVQAALNAGATCTVSKPFLLSDLWQAMQSAAATISSSRTC